MKKLCVLGITGSIGLNVCSVVELNRNDFEIVGACFNSKYEIFDEIYKKHSSIKFVAVNNQNAYLYLKNKYPELIIFYGENYLINLIDAFSYDMVVNALVGFNGLVPSVHTLNKGIDLALANKESLVVGGELINDILKHTKAKLYPIDSEHVALSKLISSHKREDIDRLVITASGGAFRDLTRKELDNVTPSQALKHPSWKMGAKITIDSASMMNKGFEIMEAYYLFNFPVDKIDVLLHDESVIHSLIKMKDNSFIADLGPADMRIPILYALYEGNYHDFNDNKLSLEEIGSLHFRKFSNSRFPACELAKNALRIGGSMGCVLNASNEVCNLAFRNGKIKFTQIEEIINKVMSLHKVIAKPTLEDYITINTWAMEITQKIIEKGDIDGLHC